MPLTRNKRKRKIRSIRKTRGRKIKRNYRKLSRKGGKRKKPKNTKRKKRNRMGKGPLSFLSSLMKKRYNKVDTQLSAPEEAGVDEEHSQLSAPEKKGVDEEHELKKLSKAILKTEGRKVKSEIKDWVDGFIAEKGKNPDNNDKRVIHDKYVKFRNLKNIYDNKKECIFCYELLETKPIIEVGCSKKCRFHEKCFINWCNKKNGIVEICPKCQSEIQNKCPSLGVPQQNPNMPPHYTTLFDSDEWDTRE